MMPRDKRESRVPCCGSSSYSRDEGSLRKIGMIVFDPRKGQMGPILIAVLFAAWFGLQPGAAYASPDALTPEQLSLLTPEQRKTLSAYQKARRAHDRKVDAYWRNVEAKRKVRRAKLARGVAIDAGDYVAKHPPAYAGPPRPDEIYALLPKPPVVKEPPRPTIPVVTDFLREAKVQYGFTPDTVTEDEFMIYYALEALKLGLTKDQVIRVYALETGGVGTHDLQSGYNPKTGRAASTALGYAQLLAANSVGQIRKHGASYAERLERLAAEPGLDAGQAGRLRRKAEIVRRMHADTMKIADAWGAHVEYGKTGRGLAMHAMNLDGDVGPWMQVTKLKGILEFAERKGMTNLTGGQLELMNLAGPGRGFEMMQPIARDMPTSNFFERGGYERNPVVHNRTGAELLAKLDEIMDRNVQKPGSAQFAVIFDALLRRIAKTPRSEPMQARADGF